MATQYQNTLTIGRYIVEESVSAAGTFALHIEDSITGEQFECEGLDLEEFDKLLDLLSTVQNPKIIFGILNSREAG
ncbi:hypothetical protein AB835_08155 [Candidatus Endobugula sertula]|uniref:Uncharacterized protein n=1 Tax=Candidatus Endobugula sertula TaxID=62101 RepID=A0A1D2QPR8_9GAMM|nr:hypothetical protein AB835_08155 [Candidatus Endobugula sertula]